ncbi:hypothetical protein [Algoriphagus aquimarinus]|uniref:hypothetical protein n=1 Tax=Algoriphagus aquimarinus TaxID=237018 RepID=UPI0030D71EDF
MVDPVDIEGRNMLLPGEISGCREHLREVSRGHSNYRKRAVNTTEVSLDNEGLNVL